MTPFVKHHPARRMAHVEAEGLAALASARCRVPRVLEVHPRSLVLERIHGAPGPGFDEALAHTLTTLHGHGATAFGAPAGGFLGPTPMGYRPTASGLEFFRDELLGHLQGLLGDRLTPRDHHSLDGLRERLADWWVEEPPTLVHGDLWAGNVLADAGGAPVLIDPSLHGGHREEDLAMMRLFGGFSERVFAAYEERSPLADGHVDRVALFQLPHLLNHALLFGGGYLSQARVTLRRYLG